MRAKRKLLWILILGIISWIGLSYALNVTQTLDNTVAYIKKMIWTNDGTDLGTKKVVIDGWDGSITMSGALNIQTWALKDDTVVSADIKDWEVKNADIANEAVTNTKLWYDAVTSSKIENYGIQSWDINTWSITNTKIWVNAVASDKIVNGSITSADIGLKQLTTRNIDDNAVTSDKLADDISIKNLKVSGWVDMQWHRIFNVSGPITDSDVATKKFVVETVNSGGAQKCGTTRDGIHFCASTWRGTHDQQLYVGFPDKKVHRIYRAYSGNFWQYAITNCDCLRPCTRLTGPGGGGFCKSYQYGVLLTGTGRFRKVWHMCEPWSVSKLADDQHADSVFIDDIEGAWDNRAVQCVNSTDARDRK